MSSLRKLDLNLLKIFEAVYVSGSVSAAADKAKMSQPSVSRGLNKLRDQLGDALFVRSGNGVVPTQEAERMIDSVRTALSLIDDTLERKPDFDPGTQVRNFRLLLPDPAEVRVVPHLINCLPENSSVTYEILAFSSTDVQKAFSLGDLDAGVLPFIPESDNVTYQKLYTDTGVLIAREDHPQLRDGFNFSLLGQLKMIVLPEHMYRLTRLTEVLNTLGMNINIACTTHKISSIPRIVATTDLVSFLPRDYADTLKKSGDIEIHNIPESDLSGSDVYLVYPKVLEEDPGVKWVCAEIAKAYQNRISSVE